MSQVFLVEASEIPCELLEDFAIIDDQMVVRLELTREEEARQERISIDSVEVEKAEKKFDLLLKYARIPSNYYDNLPQKAA